MTANSAANIPASNSIKTELAEAQVSDERAQAVGETGAEGTLANLDPQRRRRKILSHYHRGVPHQPRRMMRTGSR